MSAARRPAVPRPRGGFTLAELVMAIAVLAVAGVFLAQLFIAADRMETKASDLDRAVEACASAADAWKASPEPETVDGVPALAGATVVPTDAGLAAVGYLDAAMQPVDATSAVYRIEFTVSFATASEADASSGLYAAQVSLSRDGEEKPLYTLQAVRFAELPEAVR